MLNLYNYYKVTVSFPLMLRYSAIIRPHHHGNHSSIRMNDDIVYNRARQLVLSAGPNINIKDNILNVFGSKQVS